MIKKLCKSFVQLQMILTLIIKAKLNIIVVLISRALIYSYFNHNEFVSVNVLRKYDDMRKKIKNSNNI